jgi:molybdate transport system regulatory protein
MSQLPARAVSPSVTHKVRASIVWPGGTKLGEGRAELLRFVDETGSLRGAVKRMGMSYRAAWGYVRELEAAAGFAFLQRSGTGPAGGAQLTPRARAFIAAYDAFHAKLARAADDAFADAFAASFPEARVAAPGAAPARKRAAKRPR